MADVVRLRLEGVCFWRGDVRVLHNVNWTVRAGEHWAVLGPNGSGKTSLMMIATGYEHSSLGEVFLLDGYIGDIVLPEVRLKIGFASAQLTEVLIQNQSRVTGLEIALSGRYASIGLFQRPSRNALREARRALASLNASHLEDAPFVKMSTGQRQICFIARCLMARSKLTILDEPCAGLDLATRELVLRTVGNACRRNPNNPQVLITHHPEEIVPEITHVLLLGGGEVVAQGLRRRVLTRPNLEAAYGVPLRLIRQNDRIWIVPRSTARIGRPGRTGQKPSKRRAALRPR